MCPWHARMCVEVMCLYIFPHEAIYCCFVLLTDWKVAKFRFVKEQSALVNALSICMPHPPGFCFGEASGEGLVWHPFLPHWHRLSWCRRGKFKTCLWNGKAFLEIFAKKSEKSPPATVGGRAGGGCQAPGGAGASCRGAGAACRGGRGGFMPWRWELCHFTATFVPLMT